MFQNVFCTRSVGPVFGSVVDGVVPLHLQELIAAIHELGGGVPDATLHALTVGHVANGDSLLGRHYEIIANGKAAQVGQHIGIWGQAFVQGIMGTLFAGLSQLGLGRGVAFVAQSIDFSRGSEARFGSDLVGKGLHRGGVEVKGFAKGEFGFGHGGVPKWGLFQYVLGALSLLERNAKRKGNDDGTC